MVKDILGDYDGAIRLLVKHNHIVEALKYAAKYEVEKCPISKVHQVHHLARHHAVELASMNETPQEFEAVLECLPPADQVDHLKSAGMHDKACEILIKEGKYEELFRTYIAQAWFEDGLQLAREQRKGEIETSLMLFKATAESEHGGLTKTTVKLLQKKWENRCENEEKVSLVYGMGTQNYAIIRSAHFSYKMKLNLIGHVEALNIAMSSAEYDEQSQKWKNIHLIKNEDPLSLALSACKDIERITDALEAKERNPHQIQILHQTESFYGLNKSLVDTVYTVPPSSYRWTNDLLKEPELENKLQDVDGMFEIKVETVLKGICNRLNGFVRGWIIEDKFKLVEIFHRALIQQPLHEQMISGGYLTESLFKSDKKGQKLQQYFQMLNSAFDIAHYGNMLYFDETEVVKALLSIISPQAMCYLPLCDLEITSDLLAQKLHEKACDVLAGDDDHFIFDEWLEAWRINCVTKGVQQMKDVLGRKSDNQNSLNQNVPPPMYALDGSRKYKHVMLLWITACTAMHNKQMLTSCTIAVHNIIRHIALHESVWTTVSLTNFLHLVTIHTTCLLAMYAVYSSCVQIVGNIYIPFSYKTVVKVFQKLNSEHTPIVDFFKSCIEDIRRRKDLTQLCSKLLNMLKIILNVMTGIQNAAFNPLSYALSNEKCLKNCTAQHCLTFVLTLFGNIGLLPNVSDDHLQIYRKRIYDSVKHCDDRVLRDAYNRFATSPTIVGTFGAVRKLLEASKDDLACVEFFFNRESNKIEFVLGKAHLMKIYQRRLLFIPVEPAPQRVVMRAAPSKLRATAEEFHPRVDLSSSSSPITNSQAFVNPEFSTQVSEEADPETIAALRMPESETTTGSILPVNNDPMVDKDICYICACPLKSETEAEDLCSPPTESNTTETVSYHCHTERHIVNSEKYKEFDAEVDGYYMPTWENLCKLLKEGGDLYQNTKNKELRSKLDNAERELKDFDKEIGNIRESAEWGEGVNLLQNVLPGKLTMMEIKLKRIIEENEKERLDLEKAREKEARKEEEETHKVVESEGEDIIDQANNGGEMERQKRRMKMKKKRGRQRR